MLDRMARAARVLCLAGATAVVVALVGDRADLAMLGAVAMLGAALALVAVRRR